MLCLICNQPIKPNKDLNSIKYLCFDFSHFYMQIYKNDKLTYLKLNISNNKIVAINYELNRSWIITPKKTMQFDQAPIFKNIAQITKIFNCYMVFV